MCTIVPFRVSVCATDLSTGRWASCKVPETFFMPSPLSLDLRVSGILLGEQVTVDKKVCVCLRTGDRSVLLPLSVKCSHFRGRNIFVQCFLGDQCVNASSGDEDLKNTDATALPSVVRDAVLAWAAGTRVSARPAEAEWHDAVAADLKHQALSWRHALVLAERERHGPAASAHRLAPLRVYIRDLALMGK